MTTFTNNPSSSTLDFVHKYIESAIGDLCSPPWTTSVSSQSAREWRVLAGPMYQKKPEDGSMYPKRPYPTHWSHQNLIDGILRTDLSGHSSLDQITAPLSDHSDLARWLGTALAFDHDKVLAKMEPKATPDGTEALYETLDLILMKTAHLAWKNYAMPDWAKKHLNFDDGSQTNVDGYRGVRCILNDLLVLLNAFSQRVLINRVADIDSCGAVKGSLAIRLLAGKVPHLVPDELVIRLQWLEQNFQSEEFSGPETRELRQMINATWDRSVLERVAKKNNEAKVSGTAVEPPTTPRRRLV